MTAPRNEVIQVKYQNPHATKGLKLTMLVVPNTSDKEAEDNIRYSSEKYPKWLQSRKTHEGIAVLIGGGGSIVDHIEDILELQGKGATVFAMNGSSKWARGQGIKVDYQVIIDAKEDTATLVDSGANEHLFASQCNKKTLEKASNLTLIHFATLDVEKLFPPERVEQGGYVLLGGGSTVGNATLAAAYAQGFREIHMFGYDSSYKDGKSHGYKQAINDSMPTAEMTWAGKTYLASIAMKSQAEKFPLFAKALKELGCDLRIYGDGLLQTIYNTKYEDLTEREKYQLMWQFDTYRDISPGEYIVDLFIERFKPEGLVIDFGCGTGRAGLKMAENGLDVMLVDFTDNCRDDEAIPLPFLQWDLTSPLPIKSEYGYCTDVMEHIPTTDVESVINNIMTASEKVFFQISTVDDVMGEMIEQPLHLTVRHHLWWKDAFIALGYKVKWEEEQDTASLFYITNPDRRD
ncbi:MAG: 6-hydroxymethylpterin diphosphokinase MptE-like protein [Dehalococcoidia bacterium]